MSAVPAFAQNSDTDRQSMAERYVASAIVQAEIDRTFSHENLGRTFLSRLGGGTTFSEAQISKVGEILADEMPGARATFELSLIEATAKHFTAEEIAALSDFHDTPMGARVMSKMTQYLFDVALPFDRSLDAAKITSLNKIVNALED